MKIEQAAKIAHEVNRAYCQRLGDTSQVPWEEAPDWQKQSAISGIELHWNALKQGKELPPSASHESWLKEKAETGWKYGPVKNAETKEHPCFVPYEKLPADQQTKDYLFGAVARATFER
jgi:RyR domain